MRVWRVHPQEQRVCPHGVLKWVLVWLSACFLVFKVGPPSNWRLKEENTSTTQSPCPPCECYCSLEENPLDPLDCGKQDPVMNEEMHKDLLTMLSEELNLQKIVANETLEHAKRLVMDARKTVSHYQQEAVKCNLGVETCEEARERAEAELIEERRLTALWENRAREYGWKDTRREAMSQALDKTYQSSSLGPGETKKKKCVDLGYIIVSRKMMVASSVKDRTSDK